MCPDVTKKLNKFIDRQMKIGKPMVTFEVRDEDKRYIFSLECTGELRINILRRRKGGKDPQYRTMLQVEGSVTHPNAH